ncbi:hypothetical protein Dsin_005248 [Dipteronia sinensis]|uniref:Uncharacterized protein n=1 Tax=Dipteronia sinensis TaxID=43782 RepID=A0AAE0AW26_9ROSI|nr:hypothetical protein Dsin_005248 [Dipteronia sinensis]
MAQITYGLLGSKPTTLRTLIFGRLKLHVLALGIGENSSIFGLLFSPSFSTSLVTILAPPYGLTIGIRIVLFFRNRAPVLSMTQASLSTQRLVPLFMMILGVGRLLCPLSF